jgi:hypothetical protein
MLWSFHHVVKILMLKETNSAPWKYTLMKPEGSDILRPGALVSGTLVEGIQTSNMMYVYRPLNYLSPHSEEWDNWIENLLMVSGNIKRRPA